MEDLINDSIIESISEEYQIYQMIIEEEGNVYPQIRYVIRDENEELVRHDWKVSWSLKVDAEKVLAEIVQQRFEEVSQ
tara:strand:- start:405 stop:638 length:234 start_codon:yes stop_codon:yes gene_type:complete